METENFLLSAVGYFRQMLDVILDVLGSENTSVKFRKIISFRILSKITVKCKDKALARTELRHRHLPWISLTFWEIILDGVFQNFISTDTFIFKIGNKVTIIASINAFIIISGYYALALKSEILTGIPFHKFQVFTINRKEFRHVFPWKFERLISYFLHFSEWLLLNVATESIFNKASRLFIYIAVTESVFSFKLWWRMF